MTTDERTAKFATSCESCIFSQWYENKQNGCDLDRLLKYIATNRTTFENEKGHFIINTICNTCRGEEWANKHIGKNLIAEVEKEILVSLDFIILILNENMDKVEKRLPDILRKCKGQERIKPKTVNIVLQDKNISSTEIYKIMLEENDPNIKFNLVRILDLSYDEEQCIDAAVKKCKSMYYAIFNLCDNIPKNIIVTLNDLINVNLKSVNMIEPYKRFSGLITQTNLHRLFGGNKNLPIYEKVIEAAEFQNKKENIYKWEELWTYQK